ncbi:MAG: peptide-methionine (S)-S-oxide reductase MsrA [Bulleidia sp.]
MNNKLENGMVSLKIRDEVYQITHDGQMIGKLTIRDDHITMVIEPAYRGSHYGTNALYLLTRHAHETLHIEKLYALIPGGNETARHVVEHCGYHIEQKNSDHTLYVHTVSHTTKDDELRLEKGTDVIYLAGGCFWGMERVFQMLDGVVNTTVGYVNGNIPHPSYEDIIRNETGYRECVRVIYDTEQIDLSTILKAYFLCIDPTVQNRQKEDIGSQYQTGIYYRNPSRLPEIETVYNSEKQNHDAFFVELGRLQCFYEAEEYHQNYLIRHPDGYCHITPVDLEKVRKLNHAS